MLTDFEDKGINLLLYDSLGNYDVTKEVGETLSKAFFQRRLLNFGLDIFNAVSDKILRDQKLLEDIRAHKPDLLILDSTPPARMLTIIAYKLDCPFMFMGLYMNSQFSRTPLLPSVVPNKAFDFTDQMTFLQRLINTLTEFMLYFTDPCTHLMLINDYAPEKPYISIQDLQAKGLLWIISGNGVMEYNAPLMPNVKQVSHLLTFTPEPLSHEFQYFMDNAQDGAVIVSFGSTMKSVPSEILKKLLAACDKTKYKFVIRHPMSNSGNSDKYLFAKWLPQSDLLRHKNTRLFITHCGSNGQQEALYAGVPMIGFPLFADQPNNAARMVRRGFGIRLDLRTFAVEDLVSAIEEVITNPYYKARIQRASAIMRADRVPPVKEAAFWINHILTFGADHLKSLGQDIPLWQYLGLDVLAVCLIIGHIFTFFFLKMLFLCFSWCCGRKEKLKRQ